QQLVRDGKLDPQQAETSPHRHILTQAVGIHPIVQPSIRLERSQPGDLFILCSDGVHGMVEEAELLSAVAREGSDLQQACDTLVDLANARGGRDNSTIIILRCDSAEEEAR